MYIYVCMYVYIYIYMYIRPTSYPTDLVVVVVDRPTGRDNPLGQEYIYIYIGIENRAIKFFLFGVSDIFSHSPS